ncbi:MAG: DegT/DnrJ/EryC1/StrS family aminotransferase [Promethearchaeota archaeon]
MEIPKFPPVKHDLQTRFGSIYDDKELEMMKEVLSNDAPTSNVKTVEFEKKFASYCGTKFAIAVTNGTAALEMSYKAIDVKPGDEVITTPITWIATAAAAVTLGAKIRFADVDPGTLNIDPESVKKLINEKTKAICPVHLYGQPVDMAPLMELAEEHDLFVIEDAAHAPGALYKGKKTGSIGHMGCFSFHEQKNMSTLGEGGMITTNDERLYERARLYKSHCARVVGKSSKYLSLPDNIAREALKIKRYWFQDFDDCGYNYRMNDITAGVGLCQLEKLDKMNDRRREIAFKLSDALDNISGIKPLEVQQDVRHVYHLYPVILTKQEQKEDNSSGNLKREHIIHDLRMNHGIKTGTHYMPLVKTSAFKSRGYSEKDAPTACRAWKYLITLPIHPRMKDEHVDYMVAAIKEVLSKYN